MGSNAAGEINCVQLTECSCLQERSELLSLLCGADSEVDAAQAAMDDVIPLLAYCGFQQDSTCGAQLSKDVIRKQLQHLQNPLALHVCVNAHNQVLRVSGQQRP